MMRFRNQKGFTLLEIMLVVLIIGIIALLALPRLFVTRQIAREKTCKGNQSALHTHLEAYKWDWGVYPDDAAGAGINCGDWDTFLVNRRYWPGGHPAPEYCPAGGAYVYQGSDFINVYHENGTQINGPSEYALICPNGHYITVASELGL